METKDHLQQELEEMFDRMTKENKQKALIFLANLREEQNNLSASHDFRR